MNYASVKLLPDELNESDPSDSFIIGDWQALRTQLILQWERITPKDLEETGPNRQKIARLVELKYGIASRMIENYLRNFERTMPLEKIA